MIAKVKFAAKATQPEKLRSWTSKRGLAGALFNAIAKDMETGLRSHSGSFPDGLSLAIPAVMFSPFTSPNSTGSARCHEGSPWYKKFWFLANCSKRRTAILRETKEATKERLKYEVGVGSAAPSDVTFRKTTIRSGEKHFDHTRHVTRTEGKSGAVRTRDGWMPSCIGHQNLANPRSAPRLDSCAISSGLRPETRETKSNEKPTD